MYQYFESKESIVVTLATDTIAKLSDALQHTMETVSPEDVDSAIPPIVDVLLSSHAKHPERIAFLMEHLAVRGNLPELEEPSLALENWLGQYFVAINYASEEVTAIRVRIAVHGMSAVLRATIRYAPADMRSAVFRDELVRFLHIMLTVGM